MDIYTGEIYGKQTANKFVMYNVLKVSKKNVTLQNIDNPLSLFETTTQKLADSGYICISKTPYISTEAHPNKRRQVSIKPKRCPRTIDFLEERADNQRPLPVQANLAFNDPGHVTP
ncbi:hypothetical protein GALL_134570 [mine drainage metagenome]|uniref:Uncharacterized protein n=1 Tax=mine drainage metagenome TaxID=410659 RepID=A0A1J5S7R7_9ZZZZ